MFTLVAETGLKTTKPINQTALTLFKLLNEQRVSFTYRGARPEAPKIDSVVPRRVAKEKYRQLLFP